MPDIELNKRYPDSKAEDITDAYMHGYQLGVIHGQVSSIPIEVYVVVQLIPKSKLDRNNQRYTTTMHIHVPYVCASLKQASKLIDEKRSHRIPCFLCGPIPVQRGDES